MPLPSSPNGTLLSQLSTTLSPVIERSKKQLTESVSTISLALPESLSSGIDTAVSVVKQGGSILNTVLNYNAPGSALMMTYEDTHDNDQPDSVSGSESEPELASSSEFPSRVEEPFSQDTRHNDGFEPAFIEGAKYRNRFDANTSESIEDEPSPESFLRMIQVTRERVNFPSKGAARLRVNRSGVTSKTSGQSDDKETRVTRKTDKKDKNSTTIGRKPSADSEPASILTAELPETANDTTATSRHQSSFANRSKHRDVKKEPKGKGKATESASSTSNLAATTRNMISQKIDSGGAEKNNDGSLDQSQEPGWLSHEGARFLRGER
ncbi:uncharacterized protein IL334_000451 [Kwoniella shivajii]|uniref:DASH complex subunit ASK1 n=1 Tax=Kwoniella shivajii TaxID=564305 RepID=A0ABZ1CS89_9TREE|nr:hypothetical protein IL334_000451 [Kwoniella shivajii]